MVTEAARPPRFVVNTGARRGAAVALREGETLDLVDLDGQQTAVVIAFNAHDLTETLSPAMTRARLGSVMLQLNDRLFSSLSRPMLVIDADTVGRHDLLLPAYDINYYDEVHGGPGHDNCRANLYLAVQELGVAYTHLPDPITFFGNVSIRQRGELDIRTPLSEAGDYVSLRALMDLVVAVSASPHDHNALNGYNPTSLLLRVRG